MTSDTGSGSGSAPAPASWSGFRAAEPAFADAVQDRFGKHRHHVLATLRKDGSPRVSGIEVIFRDGELWLGMMPGSAKARDLRRDPRLALHANPGEGDSMDGGDVKVAGWGVEVVDEGEVGRFAEAMGQPLPFHLFRVGVGSVVRTGVEGARLVVHTWHPGRALTRASRA
ncbi:pyridoxamine 5'-phosphate oxidase family protein [Streptomyces sp. NPDC001889]